MSLYVLLKDTYSVENVFLSSAISFDRNELQDVSTTHWLYFNFLEQIFLLYSWRFSRYSASFHWLVHGHMTSNNETVSRQMPCAGNIAKAMTSNGKQFTVT